MVYPTSMTEWIIFLSFRPVIILGGGPAGVFTACGLAQLGISATIITRPRPFPAWEGLSDRPLESLRHFGFEETVASIGSMVARMAHWNGTSQIQNREYILNRQTFDQALLKDASNKGVKVIEGRVEKVERMAKGWYISFATVRGKAELMTDFLVEARGREAKLGRKLMGDEDDFVTAPATSALLKSYHVSPELPAITSVASFPKGWAWYLRDGKGTAILQIFVSSEKGELPSKAGMDNYFSELIDQLPEAKAWLSNAKAHDAQVSVRTAAANKTTPVGGDDFLVVGDSSMALDPLSGNGIFYAIGSGLAAAPVINTLIQRPEDKELALQFYQERIDFAFKGGCLMGREFYATEERWPDAPFWKTRRNWPAGEEKSHPDSLSEPAKKCKKPVVRGGYIEQEDVIVTVDHPRGVWQVDGIPLVGLLESIREGVSDDDYAAEHGVEKAQVISAREWLLARKII